MRETFVADASVAIGWVHPAQATAQTEAMLDAIGEGARLEVPALWPVEVANALVVLQRRRKLTEAERQAGLSWLTVLKKRENFRKAFDSFDARTIARYDARKLRSLLADEGIIRNRLKIESTVRNAKAFLAIQKEFGSFNDYLWQFVENRPVRNSWETIKQISPKTALSDAMSKDLKKRGFTFVGSTICYAFMQATGMVNDHVVSCFRYRAVERLR